MSAPPSNTALRFTTHLQAAVPNMLKDWTVSDDFKVVDCYMRKGMKWSDGEPFTADDYCSPTRTGC
jgi:peptide/nickel transport system substrate-binding protein